MDTDKIRRLTLPELWGRLSKILRCTLENGEVSLWIQVGDGEQGLYVTRNQRVYDAIAQHIRPGHVPLYVRGGTNRVMFVWGQSDEVPEQQADDEAERIRAMPIGEIANLLEEITAEMERVWGDDFEGVPDEYAWLLTHYGITEDDDAQWLGICEYYADGLSPEGEATEEWLQFLRDDQAIQVFLEQLLQKYRSNTITHKP